MKIGVDIGTSLTKAVLYDDDDAVDPVEVRSRPTEMRRPAPGRYEHTLSSVVDAVVELLAELPTDAVDLVSVTGQGDGLWLLDGDGNAVCPAVSWMDNRGRSECERWAASGATRAIFERTGNAPFPGAGAALLAAQDRGDPQVLDASETATQCQHAVFQALTGIRVATRSAAMLGIFDPAGGGYDAEAMRVTGLDHRARLLPEFAADPVITAPVRPDVAQRCGLSDTAVLASGPYDLPAAAYGAGVTDVGDGLLIVGTTLACLVRQDAVATAGEPAGLTLRTADDVGYLRAMPAMVGTAGLDWVLSLVGASHDELNGLLADSAPGAGGVASLPYFSPAGERAPFVDPLATAQFTGLSLSVGRAELVRAYCEALAYAARHCFEAAGLEGMVTACGGGTGSAALVTMFADVLGRAVAVPREPEVTAHGAVLAAMGDRAGTGPVRHVEPSPKRQSLYEDGYAAYRERLRAARVHGWWNGRHPTPSSDKRSTAACPGVARAGGVPEGIARAGCITEQDGGS